MNSTDTDTSDQHRHSQSLPAYSPTARALSAQGVQQLKQTLLNRISTTDGDPNRLLWPHRDQAMVLLMLHTGVTIDELCALNESDVIEDKQGQRCIVAGKMRRTIPLCFEVRQSLSRWLTMRKLVFGRKSCPALFVTRPMKRINRTMVRDLLTQLQHESGVAFDTFALRHTFIKTTIARGVAPDLISAMLGRPSHDVIALYANAYDLSQMLSARGVVSSEVRQTVR